MIADRLRERDLSVAPEALNLIEHRGKRAETAALLQELGTAAPAHIVGIVAERNGSAAAA